jgi:DNA-directed RNA polymerase III subunit RPC2
MGVISDQEIVSMVGSEYIDQLAPSLEECSKEKIFTANQALEYIGTRIIHMKQKY